MGFESTQEKNAPIIEAYHAGTLSQYDTEILDLQYAPIDDDFIKHLPPDLKQLHLDSDQFICDLSELPYTCPNLEVLTLDRCFRITNFEFLNSFANLKTFIIYGDTIGVTQELIDALDQKGIKHNLTEYHIELDQKVQAIVDSIITDDMDTETIVQQVVQYVRENMKYKSSVGSDSNKNPLDYALKGKGVCISYAILTNALLTKAGIETYAVANFDHIWNLIQLDGKYFYIDVTNIEQIPILSEILLEKLNIGFYYKQDPYATSMSAMSDLDELMTPLPERFLQLIEEANDEKTFIEKYGSNLYFDLMAVLGILIGLGFIKFTKDNILCL